MAKASAILKALRKVERAVGRSPRVLSEKALRSNLEAFCGDDICEAYRQGVAEAHVDILARVRKAVRDQQSFEESPVSEDSKPNE